MLNKAMLMGRLTKDPELRMTQNGVSVATFTLAVDRNFQRQGEERQADFINIVAFRHTADFVKKYFAKGQLACVCGSIQTRTWEQDGKKHYATEVIADEVHFAGSNSNRSDPMDDAIPNGNTSPMDEGFMTVSDDKLPF